MLGHFHILIALLGRLAEGDPEVAPNTACYAAYVKSMIKVRDEALLGPLPADLHGAARIQELLKNGIPQTQLSSGMRGGDRIDLHVVCKCLAKPKLTADGNYWAAQIGLNQVDCDGYLPFSTVRYSVTDSETCFAASVRAAQRDRGVVSPFFLSVTGTPLGDTVTLDSKERRSQQRVFRKGEFRLGALGYADVCNQDQALPAEKSSTKVSAHRSSLSSHFDKEVHLLCTGDAVSVHRNNSTLEFYY